jgi:hypothetical protein
MSEVIGIEMSTRSMEKGFRAIAEIRLISRWK